MGFVDALLITAINVAACLAFPKLLSMFLAPKTKLSEPSSMVSNLQATYIEITSFPYCTTYALTRRQFCKFSPHFCSQCSPNGGE
ncbi:hypothetical protein [Anabaena catenula]|uniref:Uncharacterized protein n=1 Tax=Anabaena catenula FACHB-362 TaxID=2692877 RepID=A0ABR8J6S3_9NOST|nr:hypothetical protein [Anabaena catenula]MBD2692821.1 hypothetical protein [Anabaena catenula FACHB-362]